MKKIIILNNSLTADNSQSFQFAYDSASGKYGYKVKEADTEVFVPFKSSGEYKALYHNTATAQAAKTYTFTEDCDRCLVIVSASNTTNSTGSYATINVYSSTAKQTALVSDSPSSDALSLWLTVKLITDIKAGNSISMSGRYYYSMYILEI